MLVCCGLYIQIKDKNVKLVSKYSENCRERVIVFLSYLLDS